MVVVRPDGPLPLRPYHLGWGVGFGWLQVDLGGFARLVQRTCGDIRPLPALAVTCTSAMAAEAARFGCCWETVMAGYEALAPATAAAWRQWQGQLSGRAGVTFEPRGCGAPAGERVFERVRGRARAVARSVIEQQSRLNAIIAALYRRVAGRSLAAGPPPSAAGAVSSESPVSAAADFAGLRTGRVARWSAARPTPVLPRGEAVSAVAVQRAAAEARRAWTR